jgi:Domain of unknown function (DUF4158)
MMLRQHLSPQARAALFDPPTEVRAIVRHYTFSIEDVALIRQRRRNANRLGFAVHLATCDFPVGCSARTKPHLHTCWRLSPTNSGSIPSPLDRLDLRSSAKAPFQRWAQQRRGQKRAGPCPVFPSSRRSHRCRVNPGPLWASRRFGKP